MRQPPRPCGLPLDADEEAAVVTRFLVDVGRLPDGRTVGRVSVPATGQSETFRGWRALLALLADDRAFSPDRGIEGPERWT
jgi:hypothetical protein